MNEEFIAIREAIEKIADSYLLSGLNKKIDEQINVINKIGYLIKSHIIDLNDFIADESKFYKAVEKYNTSLLSILQVNYNERINPEFKADFSDLAENFNRLTEQIDSKRIEVQGKDRFNIVEGDKFTIMIIKPIKKSVYVATTLPLRILNFFRRPFHRSPKPLRKWKRKVYLRNLIRITVIDSLLMKSFEQIGKLNKDLAESYQKIWMGEEKINKHFVIRSQSPDLTQYIPVEEEIMQSEKEFDSVLTLLKKKKDDIKKKTNENIEEIFKVLTYVYPKAGTFEYPSRLYSDGKLEKSQKNVEEKYRYLSRGWDNTLFSLFEDWKLNKDIYTNEVLEVQELYSLKTEITRKISDKLAPALNEIKEVLISSKTRIEDKTESADLKDILLSEKSILSETLDGRLISDTAEILAGCGMPETIHELESNLRKNIEMTSFKRAVVKTQVYNREIRDTEIEYIEPKELIRFEILPEFLKDTQKLKANVIEQVEEIQKELMNIGQIADFNFESAVASYESADNQKLPENDPVFIAVDGLQRAISKADEVKSRLSEVCETIINSASDYVNSFNEKILGLTRTDNILEIRLRIAKAKAIERSVQYREKTIQSAKNLIPAFLILVKQFFINTGSLYKNFRIKFGLEKHKASISTEISDFLTESETAINKLPYVYQRLFRIEPLESEKFYEPRVKEIETLQRAYNNWEMGYYAPAVLIGEKGSGVTTTINFFIKKIINGIEIIRIETQKPVQSEEDLLELLGVKLNENFRDSGELIDYLNSSANKKIIVVENMHHLFIRRIGGLQTFKILFEIVSATSRRIFWIITSNLYSWNYLKRVLNISDYFSYIIKLSPFTDSQIVDLILKRHRVSGFNVVFEPSAEDSQSKNYQRLNNDEKQKYLKEKYFSELNRFARSNLSISLFFWMRSTREVKNDIITIGSLEGLDFSFLQDLSDEKVFTLYALLIHDGLTAEQHAIVFNQSVQQSRLNLLLLSDDGIITRTGGIFMINPLLYRQTVGLLQSRNILH